MVAKCSLTANGSFGKCRCLETRGRPGDIDRRRRGEGCECGLGRRVLRTLGWPLRDVLLHRRIRSSHAGNPLGCGKRPWTGLCRQRASSLVFVEKRKVRCLRCRCPRWRRRRWTGSRGSHRPGGSRRTRQWRGPRDGRSRIAEEALHRLAASVVRPLLHCHQQISKGATVLQFLLRTIHTNRRRRSVIHRRDGGHAADHGQFAFGSVRIRIDGAQPSHPKLVVRHVATHASIPGGLLAQDFFHQHGKEGWVHD
jgi:hypothetical protein